MGRVRILLSNGNHYFCELFLCDHEDEIAENPMLNHYVNLGYVMFLDEEGVTHLLDSRDIKKLEPVNE